MNRFTLSIVGALSIVAVLGVVGAVQLAGPSSSSNTLEAAAQEATPSPTDPAATEQQTEGATLGEIRVTQYEVFIARDPFEPVIVSAPTGSGGGTETPTTSPTASPTTAPTANPTGVPTTSPTAAPTTSPTSTPSPGDSSGCVDTGAVVCDGQTVKLVDVFDDGAAGAVVQIDDTAYEVRVGETFSGTFQVRSIEAPCATLLYGDDAFTLCEGESTLK